ncbi:hypothetical protein [Sulfitobacter sp. S190]|uniref:hypothetical protein n=1 Tax=Sulfitobacter sp. S190 TaxID=2867022 RepID=UPI0021A624B4|nr:hypothetical protein [Sulfitobacter sp. S190]UWR23035.1 hypothetical protein K3756_03275 [Sulfitobacter sp. S190]
MIEVLGYIALGHLVFIIGFIFWAWWQKFVNDRPDRYGKGPGHDLRGPERGQWDRPSRK